jgi:hypothetical protein
MASEKYLAYLCSREWGLKREAVIDRSRGMCERCGWNAGVAVHHKTYARIYREPLSDLIHLCEDCHQFVHGLGNIDRRAEVADRINRRFELAGSRWRIDVEAEGSDRWCAYDDDGGMWIGSQNELLRFERHLQLHGYLRWSWISNEL